MDAKTVVISKQHHQLHELYTIACVALRSDPPALAKSAFERFAHTLEAHMALEEDIYFPALQDLDPPSARELDRLVVEHQNLRELSASIQRCLDDGDLGGASRRLPGLGIQIANHEFKEEQLVSKISEAQTPRCEH